MEATTVRRSRGRTSGPGVEARKLLRLMDLAEEQRSPRIFFYCPAGLEITPKRDAFTKERARIIRAFLGCDEDPVRSSHEVPDGLYVHVRFEKGGQSRILFTDMGDVNALMRELNAKTIRGLVGKSVLTYLKGDALEGISALE